MNVFPNSGPIESEILAQGLSNLEGMRTTWMVIVVLHPSEVLVQ
jgi:hypothetical protein